MYFIQWQPSVRVLSPTTLLVLRVLHAAHTFKFELSANTKKVVVAVQLLHSYTHSIKMSKRDLKPNLLVLPCKVPLSIPHDDLHKNVANRTYIILCQDWLHKFMRKWAKTSEAIAFSSRGKFTVIWRIYCTQECLIGTPWSHSKFRCNYTNNRNTN